MDSSTDQRRDLKFMLRPALSSFVVATSDCCRDLIFFLECSFCLNNSSFVATSIAGCFGFSGCNLTFLSRLGLMQPSISPSSLPLTKLKGSLLRLQFSVATSPLLSDWFLLVLSGAFNYVVILCKIKFE